MWEDIGSGFYNLILPCVQSTLSLIQSSFHILAYVMISFYLKIDERRGRRYFIFQVFKKNVLKECAHAQGCIAACIRSK